MYNMIISYWAVLLASVMSIIIGYIWYGPLFGKMYAKATEMSMARKPEMKKYSLISYLLQYVASIVMFYVLAKFIASSGTIDVMNGIYNALLVWIGFVVPIKLADLLWGGKKEIFWLGIGNMLLVLLVGGIIIGGWKVYY